MKPGIPTLLLAGAIALAGLSNPASGIVGGEPLPQSEQKTYEPLLRLGFNHSPCTGTHLGAGLILTAYHCLAMSREPHEDRPSLCVWSPDNRSLGCVFGAGYELSAPPTDTFRRVQSDRGEEVEIPEPDLALLRVRPGSLLRRLDALEAARVSFEPAARGEELRIAGQGCDRYDPGLFEGSGSGRLRSGPVQVLAAAAVSYALRWTPGGPWAGACPGDSGGPLYAIDPSGRLEQRGVAASIVKYRGEKRQPLLSVVSHYTRLDLPEVRAWLERELGD